MRAQIQNPFTYPLFDLKVKIKIRDIVAQPNNSNNEWDANYMAYETANDLLKASSKQLTEEEGKNLRASAKEESLVIKVQNPVREQLLLSLPRSINIDVVPQDITYHIYDLSGKQWLSGILPTHGTQHNIDVSRLAVGAYILVLPTLHQQFKIIKL